MILENEFLTVVKNNVVKEWEDDKISALLRYEHTLSTIIKNNAIYLYTGSSYGITNIIKELLDTYGDNMLRALQIQCKQSNFVITRVDFDDCNHYKLKYDRSW